MDAFVSKLNDAGSSLVYSTFSAGAHGEDDGNGIAVDSSGNAYITGRYPYLPISLRPRAAFQPSYGGNSDAFVSKLNTVGSALVYSTYLGGSDFDNGSGIAVDVVGQCLRHRRYRSGCSTISPLPRAPSRPLTAAGI